GERSGGEKKLTLENVVFERTGCVSPPGCCPALAGGRMPPMRSIFDLTTEEAYRLVNQHFGHQLPPLDAIENEDWGRDYVLQHFQRHTAEELAAAGLSWSETTP